jgi:WD40 repeat protein
VWRVTAGSAADDARDGGGGMEDDSAEAARPGAEGGSAAAAGSAGRCEVTLKGHAHRLGMVGFHPAGELVGTASFDRTWRLWHLETGKELLLQVERAPSSPPLFCPSSSSSFSSSSSLFVF